MLSSAPRSLYLASQAESLATPYDHATNSREQGSAHFGAAEIYPAFREYPCGGDGTAPPSNADLAEPSRPAPYSAVQSVT
jgi:hypothetical protein